MSKNSYSFSTNSSLDKYTPKFLQHSQNVTNFSRKVNNPIQPVAEDKYPIQIIQHSQNSEDECLSDQMLDNGIEAFYTSASSEYDSEEDPMPTNMKMTQEWPTNALIVYAVFLEGPLRIRKTQDLRHPGVRRIPKVGKYFGIRRH